MERSSWIRKMFEEGGRLKAEFGAENIFDFTLGNPVSEPPEEVLSELLRLVTEETTGSHRYMPNSGFMNVREAVAQRLDNKNGLGFTGNNIVMTCGAGGALNVIIKSLVDPGEEVVIVAPYFAEYLFYVDNHQASVRIAESDDMFQLDMDEIDKAVGPKTSMVLLNSPNNPAGAIYPMRALKELGALLDAKSEAFARPIYLVMDEPYKKLVYDGYTVPDVFDCYSRTVVATSHSKDLNLPGERIGYIAVSPLNEEPARMIDAMTLSNRILGFVNAPALFQRLAGSMGGATPDMSLYTRNRAILTEGLQNTGYELTEPGGGFYLFPKSPGKDEFPFVSALKERKILTVPGSGFGRPGHFRISFCVDPDTCRGALAGFDATFRSFQ